MFGMDIVSLLSEPAFAAAIAAHAEDNSPSILGSYPVLQFFGGLAIVTCAVLSFIGGDRLRRKRNPSSEPDGETDLERFYNAMDELRQDVGRQLAESRRVMYERMERTDKQIQMFQAEIVEKIHKMELEMVTRLPHKH